ncbi:hypothetical protein K438DRAFT_1747410 [Mycena galopus ATCC 62051]|nr:hypothetical protein K438DRAFT_1747410 [Mycena galopus ATCC 62051]
MMGSDTGLFAVKIQIDICVHEPLRPSSTLLVQLVVTCWAAVYETVDEPPPGLSYDFANLLEGGQYGKYAPEMIVQTKAPIALLRILIRTLQGQRQDGSWGSCEETAYALLALSSLPFISIMHDVIQMAVYSGRDFLQLSLTGKQDTGEEICHWICKVNFRIPPISYSYVLAALRATATPIPNSASGFGEIDHLILIPAKKVQGFLRFYRKMLVFQDCKDWQLLAYIAEGYLYIPNLEEAREAILGREGMGKDAYTEYIPFGWTSASAMTNSYLCPQISFVLMTISLLNQQQEPGTASESEDSEEDRRVSLAGGCRPSWEEDLRQRRVIHSVKRKEAKYFTWQCVQFF